jgi:hypothetical protein
MIAKVGDFSSHVIKLQAELVACISNNNDNDNNNRTASFTLNGGLSKLRSLWKWATRSADSQADAAYMIRELNDRLAIAVGEEISSFMSQLAEELHDKQLRFLQLTRETMEPILRRLERKVARGLDINIRLPPSSIFLDTLTFNELSVQFSEEFDKARNRVLSKETTIVESVNVTDCHHMDIETFGKAWRQRINDETETIRAAMKELITAQVGHIIDQLRLQLDQHRNHYETVIKEEMRNVEKGMEFVEARLQLLANIRQQLADMSRTFRDLAPPAPPMTTTDTSVRQPSPALRTCCSEEALTTVHSRL